MRRNLLLHRGPDFVEAKRICPITCSCLPEKSGAHSSAEKGQVGLSAGCPANVSFLHFSVVRGGEFNEFFSFVFRRLTKESDGQGEFGLGAPGVGMVLKLDGRRELCMQPII